ncbi:MAG TPA: cellulose biosynthesis cyclic di-GMP-binding regulatory protein BcsB [Xanthobacteraceae bacterium]|nr:cellulose biosynthesis cyclic di-GMP-binding regulatory protein BcsB [Xanthobacteraceae bacterium]
MLTADTGSITAALSGAPTIISTLTFADLGFGNGIRFANLGGRREIFIHLPQGLTVNSAELVLMLDDMTAYSAQRNLEILVNDRSAAAIALDGKASARMVRIPLGSAKTRDGFLKVSFQYAGAATQDRCIDVRSVGDSVSIRPDSAVEFEVGLAGVSDVATTAALMPHDVAIVLPRRPLAPRELAAALTVARSLSASGRRATFRHGYESLPDLAERGDTRRWSRGLVVIGSLDEVSGHLDAPVATLAGPLPTFGTLAAVRVSGLPALLVTDITTAQASGLIGSPWLAATRGVAAASVGDNPPPKLPSERVSFTELGLAPALAEVFGRAELTMAINTRALPTGTRAARLALDIMVAPDSAGERAVVSVFVNEQLLGSAVAEIDKPTRFDLPFPDGLIGTMINIRAVIQRRSAQGDCRFEPQGYPAQIQGSSTIVLAPADARAHDFSDLVALWANGLEILLPAAAAEQPEHALGMLSGVLSALSSEGAPITVRLVAAGDVSAPEGPFLDISDTAPVGGPPRVRFDRGRVTVVDRSDRTLLDLGGFATGAVAQVMTAGVHPGLWIKPLAADGTLPVPAELRLERGDVAFLDKTGVALAMSTERDTLVRIAYPDQVSWFTVAERFRSWIIGGLWVLGSLLFLLGLQSVVRRRSGSASG